MRKYKRRDLCLCGTSADSWSRTRVTKSSRRLAVEWEHTIAMARILLLSLIPHLGCAIQSSAQETKTRDQLVREDLSNFGSLDAWIYNDVERGFEAARKSGKPLLVVFRCIPCEACAQLDQEIVERDLRVQALLDQYVCVRVVQANGMDLQLFQFDYDQSFAAFIMNGDKTIYGRYGTRSHQTESDEDVSLEGFAAALEAGLEIHAAYPGNKSQLAGKQPQAQPRYGTPEQFPRLKEYASELDYEGKVAASCIHCHQVGESLHTVFRDDGELIPTQLLFPYPHPKILGLVMDPNERATILRVESDSPAAKDGFLAGDKIMSLDGQPMLSTADMQWVLHNAANQEELPVSIERSGKPRQLALALPSGWRSRGDISWRATSWALRRMTTGGMQLQDLSPEQRAKRQIGEEALALEVIHVGEYGEHAHAKNQGFVKDDVIVSIAGHSKRMRESDLFALLVNRPAGDRIPVSVRRGSRHVELSLKMQQ
jgi:serine protease Do